MHEKIELRRVLQSVAETAKNIALEAMQKVADLGIGGCKFLSSSKDLAKEYAQDPKYPTRDARVESLIKWECARSFASGFITGVGGLLMLPIQIPAGLGASWVVQSRLAGTIAEIYGHDSHEDRVRTLALCCLLGDAAKEALKHAGISLTTKVSSVILGQIPGRVFIEINKKIGFRLITKAGEKGIVNVVKIIPLLGGAVGGAVDAVSTRVVGKAAKDIFGCVAPSRLHDRKD